MQAARSALDFALSLANSSHKCGRTVKSIQTVSNVQDDSQYTHG